MPITIDLRDSIEMLPVLAEYEQRMDAVESRAYHCFGDSPPTPLKAEPSIFCLPHARSIEERAFYQVHTSLAGFQPHQVEVIVGPQDMVIRAEMKEHVAGFALKAMTHYRFRESVDVRQIRAEFRVGVLHVYVPKAVSGIPQ